MKTAIRALLAALSLIVAFFCFLAYGIYSFQVHSTVVDADVAIVLGASIEGDQPSAVFRERIRHGINLVNAGKVRYLLFTGGRPDGEATAEALVAKAYALQNGVSEERILVETKSHTTYQNLHFAHEKAAENGLQTFVVVSDPYHLRRAMRMADDLGIAAQASGTPASALNDWDFLLRETWRNATYLVRRTLSSNQQAELLAVDRH